MRKGFTVLELLVASLLLGMLMTILTMIFNQSSIAWRTGVAGVVDLDNVREKVSSVRYKADNRYVWNNNVQYVRSIFSEENGKLLCENSQSVSDCRLLGALANDSASDMATDTDGNVKNSFGVSNPGQDEGAASKENYVVNVRSWGPDRDDKKRYDNIYSVPYDPQLWDWN